MRRLLFSVCAVLAVLGCGGENVDDLPPIGGNESGLDGIWQQASQTIEIDGKNAVWKNDNENYAKGTVAFDGSSFSWTTTHIWDGQKWVANKEEAVTCNYMQTGMQASSKNHSSFRTSSYAGTPAPNTAFGVGNGLGKTVVAAAFSGTRYFYFLPPREENWIIGTPYLAYRDGNSIRKIAMQPDENCGWFKLVFSNESPPDADSWIWLGSSDQDQIGVNGVDEEIPMPFNLFAMFGSGEGEKHLSFMADDGSWFPSAPNSYYSDRCSYNFAAIIYDTDRSVNPSFTLVTEDIGAGSDQFGYYWISGIIKGMVKSTLNSDKKIECDNCAKGGTTASSMGYFLTQQQFRDAFDPNSNTNVMVCYDMPFSRTGTGLWEFDSDKMLNHQGRTVGGFFPEILQNRVLATAAGADYGPCPDCDRKYKAESFVNLTDSINPWCFERGFKTRSKMGQSIGSCGAAYGPGDFSDGSNPESTWGATSTGSADWNSIWRYYTINLWGGSAVGERAEANQFFCFESHAEFKYERGQEFFFRGDDDIWIYINNRLVIDLGGSHLAAPGYVELDKLGLTAGNKYDIDIFFCDRRTTMSNVRISTNMYFSQNTGLFVNGNAETSDAPICLNSSGGSGCAASGGSSQQCGSEIANNLHYYMQRRNGDRAGLNLDENNSYCTKSGNILTCYGGITINTANGTVKVNKAKISGGGLSGTYLLYVEAKNPNLWQPTPPPKQVTRFTTASSIFAIWGDIQYESGGAVPGLPAQLRSVRNGEQSTLAGKRVPIAFADGAWASDNNFLVSDAEGLSISINRSGLTNDDGTAEIQIYRDEAGTMPVSPNESIGIPNSRVLVLWVTGNYEASEEFTYQVNVQGSSQSPHKIKVRLPKLQFVNKGTTTPIPRQQAFGSDPSRGSTRQDRQVYLGEGLERFIAAFDPADNTLCTTCNFPIRWDAWVTDESDNRIASGPTGSSVLHTDAVEIVNGIGEFTFRGMVYVDGPGSNPAYAVLSVRGPSTLESTKAFWDGMIFTKPQVPIPVLAEIFDKDGDGKGDSLRIAYDRAFRQGSTDSPPNMIEVLWDPNMRDTVRIGKGTWTNGRYELSVSAEENWSFWTGGEQNNFRISMERDSIIIISSKVDNASFSEGIKTQHGLGSVFIRNWATYKNKGAMTTIAIDAYIQDRIPPIVISAIFNSGSCDRNVGPCDDRVTITLSEPVKKVDEVVDNRGSLPSLAVPFQYKLTNKGRDWDTYAGERDLPAVRNGRSNIVWMQSGMLEPSDYRGDSIVTITYRYYPDANTPLVGDSVKLVSGSNAALMDLEGNLPNPRERGRVFMGETKNGNVIIFSGCGNGMDGEWTRR